MKNAGYIILIIILAISFAGCTSIIKEKKENTSSNNDSIQVRKDSESKDSDKTNEKIITIEGKEYNLNTNLHYDSINGLSKDELKLLRNAYFAKYGYSFKDAELKDYFSKFDWYSSKYDDIEELLTKDDVQNIDLLLKLENNFNALSKTLTKQEGDLVGFWHLGAGVGAGYSDRYWFYNDRTFKFEISQMVLDNRTVGMSGKWYVLGDRLFLQIEKKLVIEGGKLIEAISPSAASEYEIEGGEKKIKEINPPEIRAFTLDDKSEKIQKDYAPGILIENQDFYRLSEQPDNSMMDYKNYY